MAENKWLTGVITFLVGVMGHLLMTGTVDGRNPAPPVENPVKNGINYLLTGAGFCPSTVVQDFFRFGAFWIRKRSQPTLGWVHDIYMMEASQQWKKTGYLKMVVHHQS